MDQKIVSEQEFDKFDFSAAPLAKGEYEYCNFHNCDFSNADLSGVKFFECSFTACNLSMVNTTRAALRNIKFKDCKMLGFRFDKCEPFGFSIHINGCILNYSSFYQRILKKTTFKDTTLHEVDFTQSDLSSSVFDNCDLMGSRFDQTNLEKVDFRTSYQYSIDPDLNKIKKAKFSIPAVTGLLDKYDIIIDL